MSKQPRARDELRRFLAKLIKGEPFVFIRFSDGEMEIINGHRLKLGEEGVFWSRGASSFAYPTYDHKDFDPVRDNLLREAVIASAKHQAPNYYKGIPTRHNGDQAATDKMIMLNSGSLIGLTFADLLINSNYKAFIAEFLPLLQAKPVVVIANYRANPTLASPLWELIPIPDGAFQQHQSVIREVLRNLENLPDGSVVLCSASSLTNIIGYEVSKRGLKLTLIDIGTSIHHLIGLEDPKRLYLSQLKRWTLGNLKAKLSYSVSVGSRIKW